MSKLKSKQDSFQFVPSDWMGDRLLRLCSPETRGLWIDILCLMHMSDERGYLTIKGEILDEKTIQKTLGFPSKKFHFCFQELTRFEIIKKDERGRFFCKRMVDNEAISKKRRASGKLGGNPKLKILVNQVVKQVVNQNVKQNDFDEKNAPIYIYNNIDNTKSIDIGYNNQIPLFVDKERKDEKKERKSEITITHPLQVYIRDNFPQVSRLKKQMSAEECEKLLTKFTNEQIADTLLAMENFKQLTSKYVSVYLTLNNWLNRKPNESTTRTNTNNRGANYEDALRNF
jgi:hypothetical protein